MATFNRIMILGTLGQTPHLQATRNGKPFCRLSLATDSWKKENGESTVWHSVHVFGKQAENATQYLTKGRQVFVEGRLEGTREDGGDGKPLWKTWVTADRVTFMGKGGTAPAVAAEPEKVDFDFQVEDLSFSGQEAG